MIADQKKKKGQMIKNRATANATKAKFWLLPLTSRTNSAQFCNIM